MSTTYGPYHCDRSYIIGLLRGLPELATFLGLIIGVNISDNFSRRKTVLIFCGINFLGFVILCFSQNITQAFIGIFVSKIASLILTRAIQVLTTEIVHPILQQKFLNACFVGSLLAAMGIGIVFSATGHWRLASIYLGLIPSALLLLSVYLLIKDSPKFLLRQGAEAAAKDLNWIGKLNTGVDGIYRP